jgi:hypothetical protein
LQSMLNINRDALGWAYASRDIYVRGISRNIFIKQSNLPRKISYAKI